MSVCLRKIMLGVLVMKTVSCGMEIIILRVFKVLLSCREVSGNAIMSLSDEFGTQSFHDLIRSKCVALLSATHFKVFKHKQSPPKF